MTYKQSLGDDNVSPAQNKIWSVLTDWLIGTLFAEGSFLFSGRAAQKEVYAKEKTKQKPFRQSNSKDPRMPSCQA